MASECKPVDVVGGRQSERPVASSLPKSPCTDGEVAEMVARLRRYTRSKMGAISEVLENDARQAADLLTSLSAERDRLAEEKDAITKFTNGQIARADNAEAERDALKLRCMGYEAEAQANEKHHIDLVAERDALKARVAEVLEPFASATRDADDSRVKDTAPTWESPMAACVTFGDFRRAAELHATLSGDRS